MRDRTDATASDHRHETFGRTRAAAVLILDRTPAARERVRRWKQLMPESCEDCMLYALAEDVERSGY